MTRTAGTARATQVRETVNKRNRKLIDHDRWLTNVKKAQEANEKSNGMKIAEVTKAESQFEMARQEYETINTKIKEEMPQLMAMRSTFVDPILQTLVMFAVRPRPAAVLAFSVPRSDVLACAQHRRSALSFPRLAQVEFFTTGGNALQEPLRLLGDVEDVEGTFREDIKAPIAAITELRIVNPKLIDANCEARDPAVAMRPPNMGGGMSTNAVSKSSPSLASESTLDTPPPAYTAPAAGSAGSPKVATAAATAAPPPAAPKPGAAAAPKLRKAIALYDYVSETEGDLNFSKDDVIEIVNMTESQEDWWTGRKDGREGFFPGTACDRDAGRSAHSLGANVGPAYPHAFLLARRRSQLRRADVSGAPPPPTDACRLAGAGAVRCAASPPLLLLFAQCITPGI